MHHNNQSINQSIVHNQLFIVNSEAAIQINFSFFHLLDACLVTLVVILATSLLLPYPF